MLFDAYYYTICAQVCGHYGLDCVSTSSKLVKLIRECCMELMFIFAGGADGIRKQIQLCHLPQCVHYVVYIDENQKQIMFIYILPLIHRSEEQKDKNPLLGTNNANNRNICHQANQVKNLNGLVCFPIGVSPVSRPEARPAILPITVLSPIITTIP